MSAYWQLERVWTQWRMRGWTGPWRLPWLSAAGARVMVMASKMKGNENECFQLSSITGHGHPPPSPSPVQSSLKAEAILNPLSGGRGVALSTILILLQQLPHSTNSQFLLWQTLDISSDKLLPGLSSRIAYVQYASSRIACAQYASVIRIIRASGRNQH